MENQLVFAAKLVGQTVSDILNADANGDGRVSQREVLALVAPLGMRLFTSFPRLDVAELMAEIRTSDTEARQAAIDAVKETFDIKDDELEFLIEDVIDLLEDVYTDVVKHIDTVSGIVKRVQERSANS